MASLEATSFLENTSDYKYSKLIKNYGLVNFNKSFVEVFLDKTEDSFYNKAELFYLKVAKCLEHKFSKNEP